MRRLGSRPTYRVSTGKARPALSITGVASPISAATRAPSIVADITTSRKSSRSAPCASSASARPRSASSERSWNSSKSTRRRQQARVAQNHARENALGDDLDARLGRDFGLETHAQADRFADALAKRLGHAARRGSGGETPRLQQNDASPLAPFGAERRERDACGLAGAGRRRERDAISLLQTIEQGSQNLIDRQPVLEANGHVFEGMSAHFCRAMIRSLILS